MTKDRSSSSEERTPEESTPQGNASVQISTSDPPAKILNQEQVQVQQNQGQPISGQPTQGQPNIGQSIQWLPIQIPSSPWFYGPTQPVPWPANQGHGEQIQPNGGPPTMFGASPATGHNFFHAGQPFHTGQASELGLGANPYPIPQTSFLPYHIAATNGRPEPGDPLYTSTADGPELWLITQQLSDLDNYSAWSQEFRRALVTKDKDGFIDGTIPIPSDKHLARHWRKCNQLVRTWIGNCITLEVAVGLPPTEDLKKMWENIKEMYGKLDRVKIFSLTQALSNLK